jgi:hypothetical protein
MIFNNLGQALRVSVGPYVLLLTISSLAGVFVLSDDSNIADIFSGAVPPEAFNGNLGGLVFVFFAICIFAVFVASWVAVSWHRFILLEEYSGILPATSGRPIWPYVGKSMLLGLILVVLGAAMAMILGMVLSPLTTIILLVGTLSLMWFRLGVALPATAVGKPITFGYAWEATSKINATIIGIVAIITVVSFIVGVAVEGLYGIHYLLGSLVNMFVQWLTLMIGICVLTTLYGHVIEGRPLID